MRMKLKDWMAEQGIDSKEELYELAESFSNDASCPAVCSQGCDNIEPDGHCEHGAPSLLLVLGLI